VTTLGDLVLDVIVQLDAELVPDDDRPAVTRVAAGGQAANVAAWVVAAGASARFVGKRGADAAGELVAHELRGRGVEVCGPATGRTGVVVSIAAAGERTMASDRGSAPELTSAELEPAWFDCDVLHLSGYSLHREPIASASARAAELARGHGGRLSVSRPTSFSRASASARRSGRSRPPGSSSAAPKASSSTAARSPPPQPTSSTRRAPAMPSPRAISSAASRRGSKRRRAASLSSVRCRDPDRR
jgi:sugar/nucleoside kinase (ribokinase family)